MQISLLDSLTRRVSVVAIVGYQKYISPHKGFACAHRILYGGESCSQYIKQAIAQEGLRAGLAKSRTRFQACKQANLILRSQNSEPTDTDDETYIQPPKKINGSNSCQSSDTSCNNGDGAYCIDCTDLSCNLVEIVNFTPDCADCHALDCGGATDCSTLDCSFLDCGSCGG
jgi:putative component of membrane protein insertase Oxa1/YidC/SpoIIIJ protein YidD